MILGYFAPMPPVRSGVADYAARMAEGLARCGKIRINAAGDLNLCHIGNNHLHASIYRQALATPGVILLHDALLQHLILGSLDEAAYVDEFVYNYGAWSRDLAVTLWTSRAHAMSDPRFFRYPVLKRLVENSIAVLVHGEAARRTVLDHQPEAEVAVIPHLNLEDPANTPDKGMRDRYRRQSLGLRSSDFLIGVYGHLRETKRIGSVLAALDVLRERGVPVRLLVSGSFASDDYERAIRPRLEQHEAVLLRGATAEEEFRLLIAAADVCVNLKYPSVGESSGIAVRAMALGVPVLLSEGSEAESFPAGTFVPVRAGPSELPSLVESLAWLARDSRARQTIASNALADCRARRDPRDVCAKLWNWLESLLGAPTPQSPE